MENQLNKNEKKRNCALLETKLRHILGKDAKQIFVNYNARSPTPYYAVIVVRGLSLANIEQLQHEWNFLLPTFRTFVGTSYGKSKSCAIHFTLLYKGTLDGVDE